MHVKGYIAVASLLAGTSWGASVPVSYNVDQTALRQAVAGTPLTFTLYSDAACSASIAVDVVAVENVVPLEKLKSVRTPGAAAPPKIARLNHVLTGVTPTPEIYLAVTGSGISPVGMACQVQSSGAQGPAGTPGTQGPPGPPGPPGPGAGTFYWAISALTCEFQDGVAQPSLCVGGTTVRTDSSDSFPCTRFANSTLSTYACNVDLPDGAVIEEIRASGLDGSGTGYVEAAVYRLPRTGGFGPTYLSSGFGSSWQASGAAFAAGAFDFPIFALTDTEHVVDAQDYRYQIAFGLIGDGTVHAYGFRVRYRIDP